MNDTPHQLHKAIRAAEVLKQTLRDIAGDDVDAIRDTIEGETNLHDLIAKTCENIVIDGGMVTGLGDVMKSLADRKDRIEKRIASMRIACLKAMEIAELSSLETLTGTLTRKTLPPSVIISDEAVIPSQFWKPSDPRLDKKAILAALKTGEAIPGCELSNGGETLQIRS